MNLFIDVGGSAADGYLDPFYPTTLYSMRLRNELYAGPCLRLKLSGGTEQDIGFDGSGWLDVSAITTFCGGNDGFIITWYDQSGGGVDLIETNLGICPVFSTGVVPTIGGKPAYISRASGGLNAAINAAFGFSTAPWTIEVFARSETLSTSFTNVLWATLTGANPAQGYVGTGGLQSYYDGTVFTAGAIGDNTDLYLAWSSSGTSVLQFNAGALTGTHSTSASFGSSKALHIGNDLNLGTNSWRGLIGEIAITKGTQMWSTTYTQRTYT